MSDRETLLARAAELKLDLPPEVSDEDLIKAINEAEKAPSPKPAGKKPTKAPTSAKAPAPAKASEQAKVVTVVGPKNGRWRIGRHFTSEPTRIPADELSKDDLIALRTDPRLIVSGP